MRVLALALLTGSMIAPAADPVDLGQESPALARLFTPLSAPPGTYRVYESDRPPAELAQALAAADDDAYPGEWESRRPEGMSVFEAGGTADRPKLARLFTGARVTLYRGAIRHGRRLVAYTIVSPYPDPTLSRLQPKTMVVRFEVPPP